MSHSLFFTKLQQTLLFRSFFIPCFTSLSPVQHLLHLVSILGFLHGLLCLSLCPGKFKLPLWSQLLSLCNISKLVGLLLPCFSFTGHAVSLELPGLASVQLSLVTSLFTMHLLAFVFVRLITVFTLFSI